jgi:hypothetical protein
MQKSLILLAVAFCAYGQAGLGKSTITCLDKDGDRYGLGPGRLGPDVEDNDTTPYTGARAMAKFSTLVAFRRYYGYTPSASHTSLRPPHHQTAMPPSGPTAGTIPSEFKMTYNHCQWRPKMGPFWRDSGLPCTSSGRPPAFPARKRPFGLSGVAGARACVFSCVDHQPQVFGPQAGPPKWPHRPPLLTTIIHSLCG